MPPCRCGPCNSALFADIVPPELRSTIYAFDRSFEGAVAACAAPLVGIIAEHAGFVQRVGSEGDMGGAGTSRNNARALGHSLLLCLVVPWIFCFLFYGGVHFTYPKDRWTAGPEKRRPVTPDSGPVAEGEMGSGHNRRRYQ